MESVVWDHGGCSAAATRSPQKIVKIHAGRRRRHHCSTGSESKQPVHDNDANVNGRGREAIHNNRRSHLITEHNGLRRGPGSLQSFLEGTILMRSKAIILLSVAGAVLLIMGATVSAQERLPPVISTQFTPSFSFSMIGLGVGQTARLNALNLVRTPPPAAVAQVPCKVELDLYDGQGKLLTQKTVANLGYGQADFLDVTRSGIVTTSAHVEVSGVVKIGSNQTFFCNVSTTLEIFDSVTGATAAVLANPSSSPAFIFTPLP
jgi:hypothetical protein